MLERVAIIGGGPAGCSAALQCSQLGLRVVVFEAADRYRDKPCGDALLANAVTHARAFGLTDSDFRRFGGRPFEGIDLVLTKHTSTAPRQLNSSGWVIPRASLDQALRDSISQTCDVRYNTIVRSVFPTGFGVSLTVSQSPFKTEQFGAAILATGASAKLSRMLDIDGHPRQGFANLELARELSESENYTYGLIRCESYNAQRLAFAGTEESRAECLQCFRRVIKLIRQRRRLDDGKRWTAAESKVSHWQIELETLVFYARILAASASDGAADDAAVIAALEAAVAAFTDALDFIKAFEKRNYSDIFSDRDWDRYSQELLFTRAFCHLGRLEAQINANKLGGVFPKEVLQTSVSETQALFEQLMPTGVNPVLKDRLIRSNDEIKGLP